MQAKIPVSVNLKCDSVVLCVQHAHLLLCSLHICCRPDRISEEELVVAALSENERRRGVVQSNAWRLNLFLTELHQC